MGLRCFPEMMPLFERLGGAIGTPGESEILNGIYRIMPVHNFSTELITQVVDQISLIELDGVFWSDWGRPERIGESFSG